MITKAAEVQKNPSQIQIHLQVSWGSFVDLSIWNHALKACLDALILFLVVRCTESLSKESVFFRAAGVQGLCASLATARY